MAEAFPESEGRTRFARQAFVVVRLFTKMMRELATDTIKATTIHCQITQTKAMDRLTSDEKNMVGTLLEKGYDECGFSLLYKILRQCLEDPGLGWSKPPGNENVSITDDILRMRLARNTLLHNPRAETTEEQFKQFFTEFKAVGKRVDEYLKKESSKHEEEITKMETAEISTEEENEYVQQALEIENLKLMRSDTSGDQKINIYLGRPVEIDIDKTKTGNPDDKFYRIVVLGGAKDEDAVEKVKARLAEINEKNPSMQIIDVRRGSIIFVVRAKANVLTTGDKFCLEIANFMNTVLSCTKPDLVQFLDVTAISIDNEEDDDIMRSLADEKIIDTDFTGSPFQGADQNINPAVRVDEPLTLVGSRLYSNCTRLVADLVNKVNLTGRVIQSSTINIESRPDGLPLF